MTKKTYDWVIRGFTADRRRFETKGRLLCEYQQAWDRANKQNFLQLTNGEAIFGSPGTGCEGPYTITECYIELVGY